MAAAVYGAAAMQAREPARDGRPPWLGRVWLTFGLTLVLSMLLVYTPLSPLFYVGGAGSGRGLDGAGYGRLPRDAFKDQWLAEVVPPDAPLMADDHLGTRLFNRLVYYRTRPQFRPREELLPRVQYVVLDALNDFNPGHSTVMAEYDTIAWLLAQPDWRLLRADDGLLLFGRTGERLAQTAVITPSLHSESPVALFRNEAGSAQIALLAAEVVPLGENRFRLHLTWQAQGDERVEGLTAVSRVDGLPHSRFVHLTTAVQLPPAEWPTDQLVQETVDIALPANTPPGEYPLLVGWYDMTHLFAADTDGRSRLGAEVEIGRLTVPK
ncbi:MAG: DUF2079 domain-containing protein [Anaerolineae bacterium]|nr:DUF2079 domain-containing protein [Anaerolineae bacterium]